MSSALALYRTLATLAEPACRILLHRRARLGREDAARIGERLGQPGLSRPVGHLVWFHAASVGEATSVLPLVKALVHRSPASSVLLTTVTRTAAAILEERLPAGAVHQYVPIDSPGAVRRFLSHWRPSLAIWVESEFWPTLLTETRRRGIPTILLNGRISQKSFRRWSMAPKAAAALLGDFALCLAADGHERRRLALLGAHAKNVGNLKDAAEPLPVRSRDLQALRVSINSRPAWIAASTHVTEENSIATLHSQLTARHPRLLTIIAPRHPERAPQLIQELETMGLRVACRTVSGHPSGDTDIFLVDTLGELGLFFRAVPIAFVGGSLVPHGGHNLMEPARLGCAVLHGPHMQNFLEQAEAFAAEKAALTVGSPADLAVEVDRLLNDRAECEALAEAGRRLAAARAAAGAAILAELDPFLTSLAAADRHVC